MIALRMLQVRNDGNDRVHCDVFFRSECTDINFLQFSLTSGVRQKELYVLHVNKHNQIQNVPQFQSRRSRLVGKIQKIVKKQSC